jgi:hypothetical protein
MVEVSLGRFGDRRLEKGGPFYWSGWSARAGAAFRFGNWAATVRVKFV